MLEEVVRARDHVVVDRDVLLRAQLVDQLLHRARRDDFVGVALDDDARGRAGREEGEIVHVGGRRHRDEQANLGAGLKKMYTGSRKEKSRFGKQGFGESEYVGGAESIEKKKR